MHRRPQNSLLLIVAVALLVAGCPEEKQPPPDTGKKANVKPPPTADPAIADIKYDPAAAVDQARAPKAPAKPPAEVVIRRIVIKHIGATGVATKIRTKAAADKRARLLATIARQKGQDFVELARKYSDVKDSEKPRRISPYNEGPEKVGFQMGIGQVSDAISGPGGFVIAQRIEADELASAHILSMYKGTLLADKNYKRTKKEARKRAEKLLKNALSGKTRFTVLAARYSDIPSGSLRGGVIAPLQKEKVFASEEKIMVPYFEALQKTEVGKVHPEVVETKYGFHVIKRLPFKRILVQNILIAHKDSPKKDSIKPKERRDRWKAEALARKIRGKVDKKDFAELAREYSEAKSAESGGNEPPFARGEMAPRFEQYAFALGVGRVSSVVETKYGFNIIKRLR